MMVFVLGVVDSWGENNYCHRLKLSNRTLDLQRARRGHLYMRGEAPWAPDKQGKEREETRLLCAIVVMKRCSLTSFSGLGAELATVIKSKANKRGNFRNFLFRKVGVLKNKKWESQTRRKPKMNTISQSTKATFLNLCKHCI